MSTTDPKKIAFRGTTNTDLQKHINNYFTTLGGINPGGLKYTSSNYYYFIDNSGKIIRASILPAGYIEREPGDYFKDSLGGIKDERKFAFLGSKHPEIQKAMVTFFITLGATNRQRLLCRNKDMYYFIDEINKLDCSRKFPEGYIFQLDTYLNVMKNQEEKIPEYVECIKPLLHSTVGKIYKVIDSKNCESDLLEYNYSWKEDQFKPSTKEAYNAQNTPLKAAEYTPQVGDYVVMEKAGGWEYSPDNNDCVVLIDKVATRNIIGRDPTTVYYCISGKLINPKTTSLVKFTDIPQFDVKKERVFRKALPHEIPINTSQEKPQQVAKWSKGTYAVALKGNFGVFFSANKLPIGKIFTIRHNTPTSRDSVGVEESQYWIYKENLKWFATYDEAVQFTIRNNDTSRYSVGVKESNYWSYVENLKWFTTYDKAIQFSKRLPQFEASPTAAISESPLEICRKMYKKGMLVRSAKEYGENSGEFIIDVDPSEFTNTGSGVDYFYSRGWLYINGKFAKILEESKEKVIQYPGTPTKVFPVEAIKKQIKKVKFQEVHEIKTVEEKLLKKTKSKLFNI